MQKHHLPGLGELKRQAKRLRTAMVEEGNFISHSQVLEILARQYGYRN